MRIRNKKMLLAAAIVLLLAAAAGIIIFDRDSSIDFEKNLALAVEYLERSDYDNAIAIYNGLLAEDDSCSEAYAGLAEAYYIKGNSEKALNILERGLEYSADEDIVIEKINMFFPDYDFESFWYEDDEYYAEVPDEIEAEKQTENDDEVMTAVSETEITEVIEETTVAETTAVPETEETTVTTTAEITTTAAPIVTTTVTTTTVQITTTAAPVTTTAAPQTTAETAASTDDAEIREPEAVIVDDLTMMTVSEARAWCESNNLSLSVIGGEGEIISQSPAPGSIIEEYSEIIVRCE